MDTDISSVFGALTGASDLETRRSAVTAFIDQASEPEVLQEEATYCVELVLSGQPSLVDVLGASFHNDGALSRSAPQPMRFAPSPAARFLHCALRGPEGDQGALPNATGSGAFCKKQRPRSLSPPL